MKRFTYLILCAMIFAAQGVFSQVVNIEYSYDSSGNRISRQVISLKKAVVSNYESAIDDDVFGKKNVMLFPNPTYGILNVKLQNSDSNLSVAYTLKDISGKSVFQRQLEEWQSFQVDMTQLPAGVYFLCLFTQSKSKTYKIIKR